MEAIITPKVIDGLRGFINTAKKDPKAEVECKLLSGKLQTKDVADRILNAVKTLSIGAETEEHRLTFSYGDGTRVNVPKIESIHRVIATNSFKEVALAVERKEKHSEEGTLDAPDANARFTLRYETPIRKDWEGNPNDPKAHIRLLHRKSFKTADELFRIDFSMVKTRPINSKQTLKDMIKQPHTYELEIEFINKATSLQDVDIVKELFRIMTVLSQAYYESPFLLSTSDIQRYQQEFKMTGNVFLNPVTMTRRELRPDNAHNISKGYTVTNKADGQRSALYVARDRRLLKVTPQLQVVWTGITAANDTHIGDFVDGEYIADNHLFCIFDIYRFRNRDVRQLPLMKSDEDTAKNPANSRLGCMKLFVEDLRNQFQMSPTQTPLRIETKLFLAGDGPAMEEAIRTMLTTEFEYETDGLIFTPKASPVAPPEDRKGKTWLRVYKWKPPHMNTIDFLLKFTKNETFDPLRQSKAIKGELYVSRSPGDDIIYPRETMTGEYVPRKLPEDLQKIAETNTRIPSIFQPAVPRDPDAYQILVEVTDRGLTVDSKGVRVEDNTIVECSFDMETRRWSVLRTRYDKTFLYRVMKEPQYGNDISTANNIWTSIHVPVTEEMIKSFVSTPPDDTYEDDMYYRDDLKRSSRVFADVYDFHNRIKDDLYKSNIKKDDTLLELAMGRGGDMNKWKRTRPAKVVGVDVSLANIISPTQGAAVRYLTDKKRFPRDYLPPCLFIQGDMTTYPLLEQEDKYTRVLTGKETAPTKYLSQFEGLSKFDVISCQFALHYACESQEMFESFAKNIKTYGKDIFFGTCSDGQAIYSLLLGKKGHVFGAGKQIAGEYLKEYEDGEMWTEQFGMPISVHLESFDKPAREYLVPFKKVTEIMEDNGWELVDTKLFSELYASQNGVTLTQEQQTFSFLNRAFVFKRGKSPRNVEENKVVEGEQKEVVHIEKEGEKEEAESNGAKKGERSETEKKELVIDEKKEEPEKKELVIENIGSESDKKVEEPKPKKVKLSKPVEEEGPPPVLFHGSDESKGEFRYMSNDAPYPIDMDGEKFPSVEHYYQAMKAKEFDDKEVYEKVVKTKTGKAVKAVGKKVKNFAKELWDSKKDDIMRRAVRAKFVQHPELRKQLLETGDRKIGKADPRNLYWGIGTSMESEKSKHPSKWRGQNKLGKILMELRDEFSHNTQTSIQQQ